MTFLLGNLSLLLLRTYLIDLSVKLCHNIRSCVYSAHFIAKNSLQCFFSEVSLFPTFDISLFTLFRTFYQKFSPHYYFHESIPFFSFVIEKVPDPLILVENLFRVGLLKKLSSILIFLLTNPTTTFPSQHLLVQSQQ